MTRFKIAIKEGGDEKGFISGGNLLNALRKRGR
jgi:hypothetical protein